MVEKVIKYDDKILKDFVKFHFRKINIIMLVCGALMLVAGIFYFLVSKSCIKSSIISSISNSIGSPNFSIHAFS